MGGVYIGGVGLKRSEVVETLIKQASIIEAKNQRKVQENVFNIYSVLDIERNELYTHENIIYAILTNIDVGHMHKQIVRYFLESIGLPSEFFSVGWYIYKEYCTKLGRIDLLLQSKESEKKCIIIELKIDANDQSKQLERYEQYVKSVSYYDYRIVYLTLDKRMPSEEWKYGSYCRVFCVVLKRVIWVHIIVI